MVRALIFSFLSCFLFPSYSEAAPQWRIRDRAFHAEDRKWQEREKSPLALWRKKEADFSLRDEFWRKKKDVDFLLKDRLWMEDEQSD